jgi:hypothetical protein
MIRNTCWKLGTPSRLVALAVLAWAPSAETELLPHAASDEHATETKMKPTAIRQAAILPP